MKALLIRSGYLGSKIIILVVMRLIVNAPLWSPSAEQIEASLLTQFTRFVQSNFGGPNLEAYEELYRWSNDHPGEFWTSVWQYCEVLGCAGEAASDPRRAYQPGQRMVDTNWFPGSELNFAENLLRPGFAPDRVAILAYRETGERVILTRQELLDRVVAFAQGLQELGIATSDRVAGVLPNGIEAVIAMLAATAIGAIWTCCSPDFGEDSIFERFHQIEPKAIVTCEKTTYAGKVVLVRERVASLLDKLPSVEVMICDGEQPGGSRSDCVHKTFSEMCITKQRDFAFQQFAFSHHVYILYSSGTTGAPKCIVHGAGGTLLQHLKEHRLHCDLRNEDVQFFYTTTGWMMWNWLVSGMASGATIVLYDGSPFTPDLESLWRIAHDAKVTHFGAGAKYYAHLDKQGIDVSTSYDLSALRVILSTGSPLLPESFDYIYRAIKSDVALQSISGGTDIISCFVLGCPNIPVYRGEIQAKGLGMNVQIFDEDGQAMIGKPGELVCCSPFPSMPVSFWNDPDQAKYLGSYFSHFPNIWHHGDWAEETPRHGMIIYGRSDTTLNPGGVRIGTAELYRQVEAFSEIAEAVAVPLRRDGDEQVVLFVRMQSGAILTDELQNAIRQRLRSRCSPRHVPAFIIAAPDFPRTISGKLSEIAVRNVINGMPIKNMAALANPDSLSFFERVPGLA